MRRPDIFATEDIVFRFVGDRVSPAGARAKLCILIYHRVPAVRDDILHDEVDAAMFEQHMSVLAREFNVIPLSEACARLARGSMPSRALCITFDDGYADNEEVALPILKRLGLCATFFVSTGFTDGGLMFNDAVIESVRAAPAGMHDLADLGLGVIELGEPSSRRAAVDRIIDVLKYHPLAKRRALVEQLTATLRAAVPARLMMSAAQIMRLHQSGMEIGAHTVNHPILASLSDDDAQIEIADSKRTLEEITGARVTLFAYPNGKPGQDYDAQHVRLVQHAGFSAAVCTTRGICTGASDLFQLPRIGPWDRDPRRLAARLLYMCARERDPVSREGGSPSATREPVI
jgi:peptidoglycan/xylan/chitin deacetylase (PgdA/CDA1 family)